MKEANDETIIEFEISDLSKAIQEALVGQEFTIQLDIAEINDAMRQKIISEIKQELETDLVEKDKKQELPTVAAEKSKTGSQSPRGDSEVSAEGYAPTPRQAQDHSDHPTQEPWDHKEKQETELEKKTRIQEKAIKIVKDMLIANHPHYTDPKDKTTVQVKFIKNKNPDNGKQR